MEAHIYDDLHRQILHLLFILRNKLKLGQIFPSFFCIHNKITINFSELKDRIVLDEYEEDDDGDIIVRR